MGKVVKSVFGGGSQPKAPPPPPPPPTPDNKAEVLAAEAQDQRLRAAQSGRASTMLTGGEGLAEEDVKTAKKRLLGA